MDSPRLNVVLYEPEIPPNTGNIGRLCYANGIRLHLIEPLGFSLDEKQLRRAGMDYWQDLDLVLWANWEAFEQGREGKGRLYFLTTKATQSFWDATYEEGDYLVFGPESRGLPESLLQRHLDGLLVIPQQHGRSLNLSTAVGIVLYEGLRQLR